MRTITGMNIWKHTGANADTRTRTQAHAHPHSHPHTPATPQVKTYFLSVSLYGGTITSKKQTGSTARYEWMFPQLGYSNWTSSVCNCFSSLRKAYRLVFSFSVMTTASLHYEISIINYSKWKNIAKWLLIIIQSCTHFQHMLKRKHATRKKNV